MTGSKVVGPPGRGMITSVAHMRDNPVPLAPLVSGAEHGDSAARDQLFAALYSELHRLAETQLKRNSSNLTLGATTLLHEAYLDISQRESLAFPDRSRFLAYASRAMRGLIINYVRNRAALKRGGEITFIDYDQSRVAGDDAARDLEALDVALQELALLEPALAELVDLKFFCGFSFLEIASVRGTSERTVQRQWAKARTLLHRFLT
jgi:RNA polymerase sigma factor (TIGR02999 family)